MSEDDRYCADVMTQMLRSMRSAAWVGVDACIHLDTAPPMPFGQRDQGDAMYDELIDLIFTRLR